MPVHEWHLPSNSGRETSNWRVTDVLAGDGERVLTCDVELAGQYYGRSFEPGSGTELKDFSLNVHGLQLRSSDLETLVLHLKGWLTLPLSEMRGADLDFSCDMGGLFDQSLDLVFGKRADTISEGHQVVTVKYHVGRMAGELSYVVDQSCLGIFVEGIEAALTSLAPPRESA